MNQLRGLSISCIVQFICSNTPQSANEALGVCVKTVRTVKTVGPSKRVQIKANKPTGKVCVRAHVSYPGYAGMAGCGMAARTVP